MRKLYKVKNWCFQLHTPLSATRKCYSLPVVAIIIITILFNASFIVFFSNTLSVAADPKQPISDSFDDLTAPPILLWNYTTSSNVGTHFEFWGLVRVSPIVAKDKLYFASGDGGYFYALNATNGVELWTTANDELSTVGNDARFPMVHNDKMFAGGYAVVWSINAKSGTVIWQSSISHGYTAVIGAPPAIANDILYVGLNSYGLMALNARNGEILWHFRRGNANGIMPVVSSPVVVDKVVYVSGSNTVFALNARNGREIWNYSIGDYMLSNFPFVSSVTVDKGMLYFGVGDGNVYALNADNGKKIWNYTYHYSAQSNG